MAKRKAPSIPLAEWIKSPKSGHGCPTCLCPEALEAITEILEAMIEYKAHHISIEAMRARILETVPNYTASFRSLKEHLYNHQRDLYRRARGQS